MHPIGQGRPSAVALATDLDGTLLAPGGFVSQRSIAAIAAARRAGMAVLPATARPPAAMLSACAGAEVGPLAICSNGAVLYDVENATTIQHHGIPAATATAVMAEIRRAVAGSLFGVESLNRFIYEEGMIDPEAARAWGVEEPPVVNMDAHLDDMVTKLCCWHPELSAAEMAEAVRAVTGEQLTVTSAGAGWALAAAPGITKAVGLASACEHLGLDPTAVVVVGDEHNDIPMLRWSAWPVAVANARQEVLAVAKEIVGSNTSDGVADLLDALVSQRAPQAMPSPAASAQTP